MKTKPVWISKNAVIVSHLFTRSDNVDDLFFWDNFEDDYFKAIEETPKRLLDSLEDYYSISFLKNLKKECERRLDEWNKKINK